MDRFCGANEEVRSIQTSHVSGFAEPGTRVVGIITRSITWHSTSMYMLIQNLSILGDYSGAILVFKNGVRIHTRINVLAVSGRRKGGIRSCVQEN